MNTEQRKARARELRRHLDDPKLLFSPMMAEKFKRMIWDLEQPPFSELRRVLYMETIGGMGWGRR